MRFERPVRRPDSTADCLVAFGRMIYGIDSPSRDSWHGIGSDSMCKRASRYSRPTWVTFVTAIPPTMSPALPICWALPLPARSIAKEVPDEPADPRRVAGVLLSTSPDRATERGSVDRGDVSGRAAPPGPVCGSPREAGTL